MSHNRHFILSEKRLQFVCVVCVHCMPNWLNQWMIKTLPCCIPLSVIMSATCCSLQGEFFLQAVNWNVHHLLLAWLIFSFHGNNLKGMEKVKGAGWKEFRCDALSSILVLLFKTSVFYMETVFTMGFVRFLPRIEFFHTWFSFSHCHALSFFF